MTPQPPRVALIHAVAVSMQPVEDAFRELWPEAERINLLDDSLGPDRERDGEPTPAITGRIRVLAEYARAIGARGILYTCSAFGEAIEAAARESGAVPVLKPNEAMFDEALDHGARLGLLTTFGPSVASLEREFRDMAAACGLTSASIETLLVEGAMAALKTGDGAAHDRLIAESAPRLRGCDAVMLAQFSTARAQAAVREVLDCPVLTSPSSAVRKLRRAIEDGPSAATPAGERP